LFRATLAEAEIVDADVDTIIADLNAHRTHIVRANPPPVRSPA
jgi:hypothetical protein